MHYRIDQFNGTHERVPGIKLSWLSIDLRVLIQDKLQLLQLEDRLVFYLPIAIL